MSMAVNQEKKPLVFATPYSPITEARQHEEDDDDVAVKSGCFGLCGFGSGSETWAASRFKKVKEFSEVVAGPKWKNFIRKIGKVFNSRKNHNTNNNYYNNNNNNQFQYSPESYGLNFAGDHDQDDEKLLHSFSTRFASHAFANANVDVDVQQRRRAGL